MITVVRSRTCDGVKESWGYQDMFENGLRVTVTDRDRVCLTKSEDRLTMNLWCHTYEQSRVNRKVYHVKIKYPVNLNPVERLLSTIVHHLRNR